LTKRLGPEKHPRETNKGEYNQALGQTRATVAPPGSLLEAAIGNQSQAVQHTPNQKCPRSPVPQPGDDERDQQIAPELDPADATASKRDVHIIAEPSGKADVPARPKIGQAHCEVRVAEVEHQAKPHAACDTARHVGVATEVKINLPTKGERRQRQCRPALCCDVAINAINVRTKVVGQYHFFEQSDEE
jgi:hypothetical protein